MVNARIYIAVGVAGALVLAYFIGDHVGYKDAVADYSVQAADLAQKAKKKQAIEQIAVNDLADQYYKAQEREHEKSIEVDALKRALRERDSMASNDDAPYRLFNEAANSANLPDNPRTQAPDAERDSLDAIQYSVAEFNRVAQKANTLTAIIAASECFKPP
jgi:hypothetical protein